MGCWKDQDHGASATVGEIILVALAFVGAAAVYVLVGDDAPQGNVAAEAVALTANGHTGDTSALLVASATTGLTWDRIVVLVDGGALPYDAGLAATDTWCRTDGATCASAAEGDVLAGQSIRVRHDADGTLELRDGQANGLLWRANLG